jgi:hypothetical protein
MQQQQVKKLAQQAFSPAAAAFSLPSRKTARRAVLRDGRMELV